MNEQTSRIMKIYLSLGWVKLDLYYRKMTQLAYAGATVMNPFKKMQELQKLWSQIPQRKEPGYLPTVKTSLRALWTTTYKNHDLEVPTSDPPVETFDYEDFTTMRLQFSGRSSRCQKSQQSRDTSSPDTPRRRHSRRQQQKKHTMPPAPDELTRYLKESPVAKSHYNGDPLVWWREVGSSEFPQPSLLAADLLSIPSSTAVTERSFSSTAAMITPKRNRLRQEIIAWAQCLGAWIRSGIYKPTETYGSLATGVWRLMQHNNKFHHVH
jgi:hypothetical protein